MARLLEEARGSEGASVKKVEEDEGVKDSVRSGEAKTAERGLLVHGLKGRKPKLSEEKREEILTEDTIR